MSSYLATIEGVALYFGVSAIMVAVPAYSWAALFFGIPMGLIEPIIAIYCYM